MRAAILLLLAVAPVSIAFGEDTKELDRATFVYARGGALYKSDGKGKTEAELVKLPAGAVRALHTDPNGKALLADVGGKWYWMPLDASKPLAPLPCGDGAAQLDADATCVLCRGTTKPTQIVQLATGKTIPLDVPFAGARIVGTAADRKLVWSDGGVWIAPLADLRKRTKVAAESPLRNFMPSPDGKRAVGVYADYEFEGTKKKVPADVLMSFPLDGSGARRKIVRRGVPLEWTPNSEYVLVQNGGSACMVRVLGGETKCYKGFTAVSIAPDASWVLMVGDRDKKPPVPSRKEPMAQSQPKGEEASDPDADTPVAPPSGPLSLYRGRIEGLYDSPAVLVTKTVDGAAVWVPGH